MKKSSYILKSLLNAAGVFVYIALVAWLVFSSGKINGGPTFLAPVIFLLSFIVSASITGLLVLGKPIAMYLDGRKKEAFIFLFATLGWLVLFLAATAAAYLFRG